MSAAALRPSDASALIIRVDLPRAVSDVELIVRSDRGRWRVRQAFPLRG